MRDTRQVGVDGALAHATTPSLTKRRRRKIGRVALIALLLLVAFVEIYPFLWLLSASLRPPQEVFSLPPPVLPTSADFGGYGAVLTSELWNYGTLLKNSILIASASTLLQLVLCAGAAYVLAFIKFRGRGLVFGAFIASLLVPPIATIAPLFLLTSRMGLIDTRWAVILPYAVGGFGVFLLRQYMLAIPTELLDAASVEGADHWIVLRRVVVPLIGPGLAALGTVVFLLQWNNFVLPLLFISDPSKKTLSLVPQIIVFLKQATGLNQGVAVLMLSLLPMMLVFLFAQRFIVKNLTRSGIKG